jgi:hypothetical protein
MNSSRPSAATISTGVEVACARTLAIPFDIEAFTNAIRVPSDAGEDAGALGAILRRIPDGWGRWIGVGCGWYPIVTALDRKLADLDRGYRVLQVKEKFGTLRYYWDPDETNPSESGSKARSSSGRLKCCRPEPVTSAAARVRSSSGEAGSGRSAGRALRVSGMRLRSSPRQAWPKETSRNIYTSGPQ